jgi:hypothetical protein
MTITENADDCTKLDEINYLFWYALKETKFLFVKVPPLFAALALC